VSARLNALRSLPISSSNAADGIVFGGGVSERPKEHASKACEVKASVGSNPTATAMLMSPATFYRRGSSTF
jgi:hypothetical protein